MWLARRDVKDAGKSQQSFDPDGLTRALRVSVALRGSLMGRGGVSRLALAGDDPRQPDLPNCRPSGDDCGEDRTIDIRQRELV